ncbi:hypothetical protein [Gilvimarinus xylanilyticus]|uniref:Uncharacterized protein n=1 Tax=Gilvimarinus xylanilyticus TaxID=2944139 RepID=A0A9X2I3U1_9GAMM|nr:hypothetical protein [Gilvimarinus xylanilyticus]MCP8900293.1 hypothetical protein [Gilvimarinus xylanilyticus]
MTQESINTPPNTLAGLAPMGGLSAMQQLLGELQGHLTPLEQGEPEGESQPVLLVYLPPQLAIAQALDAGTTPQQAAADWCAKARQVIEQYVANPLNSSTVSAPAAQQQAESLAHWLNERHGLQLQAPEQVQPANNDYTPLAGVTAALLSATHPDILALLPELQAISLPLEWAAPQVEDLYLKAYEQTISGGDALEQLRAENSQLQSRCEELQATEQTDQALEPLQKQLADAQDENKLLLDQLFTVQEQLETYYLQNQTADKQLAEAKQAHDQQLQQSQSANTKLQTDLNAAQKELKAQQAELAKAGDSQSAQLKQSQSVNAKLQADLKAVKEQIKTLQTERDTEQKALSEQLKTAQSNLDKAEQALAPLQTQLSDTKDENKLILDQLFLVQEQLEEYYLKNKALEKEQTDTAKQHKKALDDAQKQHNKALADATKRHDKALQKAQQDAAKQAEKLQKKIDELEAKLTTARKAKDHATSDLKSLLAQSKKLTPKHSPMHSVLAPARMVAKQFSPKHRQLKKDVDLVKSSELFDGDWYLQQNPDVVFTGAEPAAHYVLHGGFEGRNPSPQFDSQWYLGRYPDVATNHFNPLVHYLKYGQAEGRACHAK